MKKVYIKGNRKLGEQVIDKLISLGGKNVRSFNGESESAIYYIGYNNEIKTLATDSDIYITFILPSEEWEEIKLTPVYKKGDIVVTKEKNSNDCQIFLVKEDSYSNQTAECYFGCATYAKQFPYFLEGTWRIHRKANKEEEKVFYNTLIENNVYWDEKKEKLVELKFKIGDCVKVKGSKNHSFIITEIEKDRYRTSTNTDSYLRFADQAICEKVCATCIPPKSLLYWIKLTNNSQINNMLVKKFEEKTNCSISILGVKDVILYGTEKGKIYYCFPYNYDYEEKKGLLENIGVEISLK